MEYIKLNDELFEKLDIVRFNINEANPQEISMDDTIEILIALYWDCLAPPKNDINELN